MRTSQPSDKQNDAIVPGPNESPVVENPCFVSVIVQFELHQSVPQRFHSHISISPNRSQQLPTQYVPSSVLAALHSCFFCAQLHSSI